MPETILTLSGTQTFPHVEKTTGEAGFKTEPVVSTSGINGKFVTRLEAPPSPPEAEPYSTIRLRQSQTIPIFAFDGGGARVVFTLELLMELEDDLRRELQNPSLKLGEVARFVGGTSVGGIVALGMVKRDPLHPEKPLYSIREINTKVDELLPQVFKRTLISEIDYYVRNKPRYNQEVLNTFAQNLFQGDLAKNAVQPFVVATNQLCSQMKTRFITRQHTVEGFFRNCPFEDLTAMTSAAPTYFQPKCYLGEYFTDGGTTGANNPEVAAWIEAQDYYGPKNDFVMCSFGTCITPTPLDRDPTAKNHGWGWGTWVWDENILNVSLNGPSIAAEEEMKTLLNPNSNFRWQKIIDKNIPLDETDPTVLQYLRDEARSLKKSQSARWAQMVETISKVAQ